MTHPSQQDDLPDNIKLTSKAWGTVHPQYHRHTDSLKSKVGRLPGDEIILSVHLAVGTEGVFGTMHNMMVHQ